MREAQELKEVVAEQALELRPSMLTSPHLPLLATALFLAVICFLLRPNKTL